MAYNVNNSILTNQQAPADAKILVGDGQEYATLAKLTALSDTILRAGMKCTEVDTKTTYIWNGTAWVNESFGGTVLAFLNNQNENIMTASNTINILSDKIVLFSLITFGNIKTTEWVFSGGASISSSSKPNPTVQFSTNSTFSLTITNNFGEEKVFNFTANIDSPATVNTVFYGFEDNLTYWGVNTSDFEHAVSNSTNYDNLNYETQPQQVNIDYPTLFPDSGSTGFPWIAFPASYTQYTTYFDGYFTEIMSFEVDPDNPSDTAVNWLSDTVTYGGNSYIMYKKKGIKALDGSWSGVAKAALANNYFKY